MDTGDRDPAYDAVATSRLRVALELEIPSDVRYIESVVGIVARHCEQFRFTQRQCALNIPVALSEALSNAILRGNSDRDGPRVQVKADVNRARVVLEVVDEGSGIRSRRVPERSDHARQSRARGWPRPLPHDAADGPPRAILESRQRRADDAPPA